MTKVYQIKVVGSCDIVSNEFKCSSKEIYTHRPSQENIDEFIKRCTSGAFINLNPDKPYKVVILELDLIDNKPE